MVDAKSLMGLSIKNKGESALSDSIDSHQMVRSLSASQKHTKFDMFLMITCAQKDFLGLVTSITGSLPRSGQGLSLIINQCLKSNTLSLLIQSRNYSVLFLFEIGWNPNNYGWILYSMMYHVMVHALVCFPGVNTK